MGCCWSPRGSCRLFLILLAGPASLAGLLPARVHSGAGLCTLASPEENNWLPPELPEAQFPPPPKNLLQEVSAPHICRRLLSPLSTHPHPQSGNWTYSSKSSCTTLLLPLTQAVLAQAPRPLMPLHWVAVRLHSAGQGPALRKGPVTRVQLQGPQLPPP